MAVMATCLECNSPVKPRMHPKTCHVKSPKHPVPVKPRVYIQGTKQHDLRMQRKTCERLRELLRAVAGCDDTHDYTEIVTPSEAQLSNLRALFDKEVATNSRLRIQVQKLLAQNGKLCGTIAKMTESFGKLPHSLR